jgi:hypothetical protein
VRLPQQEGRVFVPVPRAAQEAPLDAAGPIGAAALEVPTRVVERGMVCLTMGVHAREILVDVMCQHFSGHRIPLVFKTCSYTIGAR